MKAAQRPFMNYRPDYPRKESKKKLFSPRMLVKGCEINLTNPYVPLKGVCLVISGLTDGRETRLLVIALIQKSLKKNPKTVNGPFHSLYKHKLDLQTAVF